MIWCVSIMLLPHYVVDGGKQRLILAALVTPAEVMENQPMLDLIFHARFRWQLHPKQVTGDTKYGTLENVKALEDAGMRAYMPLFNRDNEHGAYYGSSRFVYDAIQDRSICPNGHPLHLTRMEYQAEKAEYQADAATCNACPRDLRNALPVHTGGRSIVPFTRTILNESKAMIKPKPTRKPCASGKCGSNPFLERPKSGMGCGAFA